MEENFNEYAYMMAEKINDDFSNFDVDDVLEETYESLFDYDNF